MTGRLRCECGKTLTIGSSPGPLPRETAANKPEQPLKVPEPKKRRGTSFVVLSVIAIFVALGGYGILDSQTEDRTEPTQEFTATSDAGTDPVVPPIQDTRCGSELGVRPGSGYELARFSRTGNGRLTIENGTDWDGVAVLVRVDTDTPYRAIYVRAGENGVFTRIADGFYRIRFQLGENWLRTREFCQSHGTTEFDQTAEFSTRHIGDGIYYDEIRVTLHSTTSGNARTSRLSDRDFALPPL